MKREKKYLLYGIGLVLLTFIGVSLAYFSTVIVGDKKEISVDFADLKVVFNGSNDITGTDIEPGWSDSITFSVENKTKREYNYNIVLEDFINTFKTSGYLVYKITSNNGYNMEEYKDIPKRRKEEDVIIAYDILIEGNTAHNYNIELKYINDTEVDQSDDMNSFLAGSIYIQEGTTEPTYLIEAILRDNPSISERTSFSSTNVSNTTGTIYKTNKTEDGNIVYYYSGNTTNNWVKFGKYKTDLIRYQLYNSDTNSFYSEYETLEECNSAKEQNYNCIENKYASVENDMYWRIIRTNEDGSVRLLYAGTSPSSTEAYIGYVKYNSNHGESRYVGYMYGGTSSLADNRTNTTSSTIKGVIDTWYQNNLLTNYDKYISKSAIYCNDRSVSSGTWSSESSVSNKFYYGAYTRLNTNKTPSYKCGANISDGLFESTQAVEDKFSASTTGGGNGQLTYPIALMTADEVVFAGGSRSNNLRYPYAWYYSNSAKESVTGGGYWFLMSPYDYSEIFIVTGSYGIGILSSMYLPNSDYVRPVISISSCAKVTGSGTPEDPYQIDEVYSTC